MATKLGAATLIATLVVAAFVGVSYGRAPDASTGTKIVLHEGDVLAEDGRHLKAELLDADDQPAGVIVWHCVGSHGEVSWTCTTVMVLSGTATGRGKLVTSGIFRGFNGERVAVTGGTGAYAAAGGQDRLSVTDAGFTHTITLAS